MTARCPCIPSTCLNVSVEFFFCMLFCRWHEGMPAILRGTVVERWVDSGRLNMTYVKQHLGLPKVRSSRLPVAPESDHVYMKELLFMPAIVWLPHVGCLGSFRTSNGQRNLLSLIQIEVRPCPDCHRLICACLGNTPIMHLPTSSSTCKIRKLAVCFACRPS